MKPLFRHYDSNTQGRDFVVGDIHGCFYLLEVLLATDIINFDESCDRVFSLGDLCDGGPESHRVNEFLNKPWFNAIRGNHEHMMIQGASTIDGAPTDMQATTLWLENGANWFFEMPLSDQAAIYSKVQALPVACEVDLPCGGMAALAHGDVLKNSWGFTKRCLTNLDPDPDFHKNIERLVWGRTRAREARKAVSGGPQVRPEDVAVAEADVVFFGHTPAPRPLRVANTRWLDTGAGKRGAMSLAELKVDGKVWMLAEDCQSGDVGWDSYEDRL